MAIYKNRKSLVYGAVGLVVGFVTAALGERAWIVMPAIIFVGFITLMLVWPRRQITAGSVAFVAGVAILLGAILKVV